MAIDEDDEFFLTLTNVGQIMRPDLFEQHTVHFHGYPNASSYYDGVPDASVAINVGGSFTYYYLAPDAGTYFWHCHISPPEHLQMALVAQQTDPRIASNCATDILCSSPLPAAGENGTSGGFVGSVATKKYAYNDGDGSTRYDVEYPIQMMGFDPNFHFVGMTFNPESFADMKDKYFMLNGRSYPDTVQPRTMTTQSTDGTMHASQPVPTIINIPAGGRALLRISDLNVTEYHTLASLGIPMRVIALNARLLRDTAGNDMTYVTNSITLGGGESLDVILDATGYAAGQKFYLYTPQLDHLSNDAENFGGMMTEINICNSVDPTTKACS
jgi:FtsP/CotA-like multicopper oxidase with cupredoxin domain